MKFIKITIMVMKMVMILLDELAWHLVPNLPTFSPVQSSLFASLEIKLETYWFHPFLSKYDEDLYIGPWKSGYDNHIGFIHFNPDII